MTGAGVAATGGGGDGATTGATTGGATTGGATTAGVAGAARSIGGTASPLGGRVPVAACGSSGGLGRPEPYGGSGSELPRRAGGGAMPSGGDPPACRLCSSFSHASIARFSRSVRG